MTDLALYKAIVEASEVGEKAVVCTVIRSDGSAPREAGAKMLVRADRSIIGTIGGGTLEHAVRARAAIVAQQGVAELFEAHLSLDLAMCCGGRVAVFLEPLNAGQDLIVFGTGHVGAVLCSYGASLGFRVVAVDQRDGFVEALDLPSPHSSHHEDPFDIWHELPWGPRCHAVVMTHSHALDQAIIERALSEEWAYLGLIGSQAKVAKFRKRLLARGASAEVLDRLHAPIGLDIGAETPAEIAIAVAAELVARRRSSTVGELTSMRERPLRRRGTSP